MLIMTIMICPVCKARNEQGTNCRRCRADLSLLFALAEQRSTQLAQAIRALQQGTWEVALEFVDEADKLRRGNDTERVRAVCNLLRGDFANAWRAYVCQLQAKSST